jgi:hypothetical protein
MPLSRIATPPGVFQTRALWLAVGCIASIVGCGGKGDSPSVTGVDSESAGESVEARCAPEAIYEEDFALPSWVTVLDSHVYWLEQRTAGLRRVPTSGGLPQSIAGNLSSSWASIASDNAGMFVVSDGQLRRISEDGSEDVVVTEAAGERALDVGVMSSHVYWLSASGNQQTGDYTAQVRRVAIDGDAPSQVLWSTTPGSFASGLALAGGRVFVSVFNWTYFNELQPDGEILRVSETTGEVTALASGLLVPRVEAADDRHVYFTAQTADRYAELWRVAITGGAPELIQSISEHSLSIGRMLIQDDTAWWTEANGQRDGVHLYRANTVTGGVESIATIDARHMLGLALDDEHLFFSTSYSLDAVGPAAIWRIGRDCSTE